jgi:hypothetical protein
MPADHGLPVAIHRNADQFFMIGEGDGCAQAQPSQRG